MSKRAKVAIIVEGLKTEPKIIENIVSNFELNMTGEAEIITLPACTNIYALWKKIVGNEYADIIELVIEMLTKSRSEKASQLLSKVAQYSSSDFSEIYLFFDYDGHNDNLPNNKDVNEVLQEMLQTFDNETDNGKMYISYPMAEALKHYTSNKFCADGCLFDISKGTIYKKHVSDISKVKNLLDIKKGDWEYILQNFLIRISCLFDYQDCLNIEEYKDNISTENIFNTQYKKFILPLGKIMVLSAMPEFIMEYFKTEYLSSYLENTDSSKRHLKYKDNCLTSKKLKSALLVQEK